MSTLIDVNRITDLNDITTESRHDGAESIQIEEEKIGDAKKRVGLRIGLKTAAQMVVTHIRTHAGVGMVCAVAYFDPGNWGVDLKAGSQYGYRLLFVVLLAGIIAVFFQILASRLGCITGLDLASHCRILFNRTPKSRWFALYPLYILAEIAIIATDLAELLGSAIALVLLFPKLELWHGVLITTFDVLILLALGDPLGRKPVRWFEWLISALVLAVLICMCIILARVDIDWGDAFLGYLPSKYIIPNGALYTSVGILGATVMPHSLFLGSSLATQDRSPESRVSEDNTENTPGGLTTVATRALAFVIHAFRTPPPNTSLSSANRHSERENNSLQFVKDHLYHGIVDVSFSLLGFAVLINSSILIISSAVFFDREGRGHPMPAGLFEAYELIEDTVGEAAATLFAVALLAAGQSASVIATVAGQAVSEGFLQWRTSPVLRRLLTRLISVIPSMTVAVAVGREGIDSLLVISQVVLSVVLPFITFPLIYLTSKKEVMRVRAGRPELLRNPESSSTIPGATDEKETENGGTTRIEEVVDSGAETGRRESARRSPPAAPPTTGDSEAQPRDEYVYFNNGFFVIGIGGLIWLLVLAANTFVIVTLALGKGDG